MVDSPRVMPTPQPLAASRPEGQDVPQTSCPQQRWQLFPAQPPQAEALGQITGLSPLVAQVLMNRGIYTPDQVAEFLNPETQQLPAPISDFPDLSLSVEMLVDAVRTQQKIAICGDYDADGMTSTALLLRALRTLGADVDYAIPSRMQEGYGINQRIVEEFYAEGVALILTVDNGIAAVAPVARARELGMGVIITDHHDVPPQIPPANAILNPKLIRPDSPYRGVAGVGVAYILAVCLAQALDQLQNLTAPLLELFTLGTIADLAPLTGVNRRWVRRGLQRLPQSQIPGVQALIQVAGLSDQTAGLKPEAIGFRLGPRINAVGRIADPQIVIEMLTTDDPGVALQRAMQCEATNQQRQQLCQEIEQEAVAYCEDQQQSGALDLQKEQVLLVVQPGWHHGVIGIVASRLVERYGVPVFIGTYEDESQQVVRGSARSIPEFNVFEALQACSDLMEKFGGHRAAGGFSFLAKHLRPVRSRLSNVAHQQLRPEHLRPLVVIDAQAQLDQLNLDLHGQIDQLHPCGIENPDPIFWTPNLRLVEQKAVGKQQDHLKLRLMDDGGQDIRGIAWRWGEYCPLPSRVDVAYKLKLNEWRGRQNLELEVVGLRPAVGGADAIAAPKRAATKQGSLLADSPPEYAPQVPPSAPVTAPSLPATAPEPSLKLIAQADFDFSKRRYTSQICQAAAGRQLQIYNPEGQRLVVDIAARQGVLHLPGQAPQGVDLGQDFYFNLVRAGLAALEVQQTRQLLMEKDELLADKDSQITTLTQQVTLLEAKLSQLSAEQQQQFQSLQASLQQQTTAIQDQEAHIAELQSQTSPSTPPAPDPKQIKQQVRQTLGDNLWFLLKDRSQKDLCAAYKQEAMYPLDTAIAASQDNQAQNNQAESWVDYSDAGRRLGSVVQREVVQPFLADLNEFLNAQGQTGGTLPQRPSLPQLPPLLATAWRGFDPDQLATAEPPAQPLTATVAIAAETTSWGGCDRNLISAFLAQWEHPLAPWCQQGEPAASQIYQISQLHALASQPQQRLSPWQYQLLRSQVLGGVGVPGLLKQIYTSSGD